MAIAKREKAWKDKIQPGKQYSIDDALKMVKEFATAKFNETVDCAVNLASTPPSPTSRCAVLP